MNLALAPSEQSKTPSSQTPHRNIGFTPAIGEHIETNYGEPSGKRSPAGGRVSIG